MNNSRAEALEILRENVGFEHPEPCVDYALRHSFKRSQATPIRLCSDCGQPSVGQLGQYCLLQHSYSDPEMRFVPFDVGECAPRSFHRQSAFRDGPTKTVTPFGKGEHRSFGSSSANSTGSSSWRGGPGHRRRAGRPDAPAQNQAPRRNNRRHDLSESAVQ